MNRSIHFSLICVPTCAGILIAAGCGDGAPKAAPATQPREPVAVKTAPVQREPIPDLVDFVGTLFGDDESLISAKTAGRIIETRVDLGDRVDDRQVLAIVDPTDARLEVERREMALREALASIGLDAVPPDSFDVTTIATVRRAAVQAENAKSKLDRAKQLFEQTQPLISAQDFADIETQRAVAQQDYDVAVLQAESSIATAKSRASELAVAKQQLADTVICAPNAATQPAATGPTTRPGRWAIAERRISVGEYVAPGSVVYRVITDQPIKLRASIPERFVNAVAKDQPASMWIDASTEPASGTVTRVSPTIDVASRTFPVEMTFANSRHRLKPGGFGRGQITIGTRNDVSTVPLAAVFSFAGLDKVFTVKDGTAITNVVKIVSRDAQRVVVEGDLSGARDVITSNLGKLATGDAVKIENATASESK